MNILDEIFAHKREEVAERKRAFPLHQVRRDAEDAAPALDFVTALRVGRASAHASQVAHAKHVTPAAHTGENTDLDGQADATNMRWPALIAEIKRASPSRGLLVKDFDPLRMAQIYQENGASAISVLTDERYFQGHLDYLRQIAQRQMAQHSPRLPLLRKDFTCDPYQVYEARAAGADAMLLIAAYLDSGSLRELHALINELGMAALVEVHSHAELEAVLPCGPRLVGVNNRDLRDFTVRLETTLSLRPLISEDVCMVAESGIHTTEDIARLAEARVDAILVGEALVTAQDTAEKVRSFANGLPIDRRVKSS